MTTSESEMLILNSTGNLWVSTRAARLLITPVETTIGLGFEVEIHFSGVCRTSFSSEFLLDKETKTLNRNQFVVI